MFAKNELAVKVVNKLSTAVHIYRILFQANSEVVDFKPYSSRANFCRPLNMFAVRISNCCRGHTCYYENFYLLHMSKRISDFIIRIADAQHVHYKIFLLLQVSNMFMITISNCCRCRTC
jgi:hypothetical protein